MKFGLRNRTEYWLVAVSAVVFSLLNAITVCRYYGAFSVLSDKYHQLFVNTFRISGFDPLTYEVLSNWTPAYNVFRHPLLAFFMYPFNQLNQALIILTGTNFATIVTAIILVGCSTLSSLLLYRILYYIIGVRTHEALSLVFMYFGFAFIMLSTMVPDHFVMSMAALLLTLYVAGKKLHRDSALNMWQTILLFVLTAGISLNNGTKVFLAALVTRRRRFFNWKYLLLAVLIPTAVMWKFARWEYKTFVWPKEMARKEAKAKTASTTTATTTMTSTTTPALAGDSVKTDDKSKSVAKPKKNVKKRPKPIMQGEFMRWTDISTPRMASAVENLFGEAIQLHRDHCLGDVYRGRPAIVKYRSVVNYVVEGMIVLLFAIGLWFGRRSRFLWTAMSFFAMDMLLHMGLGFGIDEIYIMSPHYLFVIPLAIAYIIRNVHKCRIYVTSLTVILGAWLWMWNLLAVLSV